MRFVFVMDPMEGLLPAKDTSIAFMRAASKFGHACLHCEPRHLALRDGRCVARTQVVVPEGEGIPALVGEREWTDLESVDAVFIRKDPPFNDQYLYATLILEFLRGKTLVINDPRGIREANEKLYPVHFSQHMPRTFVGADRTALLEFMNAVGGKAVIKPLDGAGGAGVLMISQGDKNNRSILDLLTQEGRKTVMAQEYLPSVVEGDKRVLLLDGKVLGAINRVPRGDDLRSNIHVGGRVDDTKVSAREQEVIDDIGPRLIEAGLYFVGLDLIGGRLTEVNVTSPTGIQEMSRFVGRDLAEDVIRWVEARAVRH